MGRYVGQNGRRASAQLYPSLPKSAYGLGQRNGRTNGARSRKSEKERNSQTHGYARRRQHAIVLHRHKRQKRHKGSNNNQHSHRRMQLLRRKRRNRTFAYDGVFQRTSDGQKSSVRIRHGTLPPPKFPHGNGSGNIPFPCRQQTGLERQKRRLESGCGLRRRTSRMHGMEGRKRRVHADQSH